MIPYLSICLIGILAFNFHSKFIKEVNLFNFIIFISIFFIALRDYVGPDWYVLTSIQNDVREKGLLFLIYQREPVEYLFKYISSIFKFKMYGVFFIYSFFSIFILARIIRKISLRSSDMLFYLSFSIPFLIIFININSPRQAFAMFLITYILFKNKSEVNFLDLFYLLVAILTHNSSIILAPLLFFKIFFIHKDKFNLNFFKKNKIIISSTSILIFSIVLYVSYGTLEYLINHYLKTSIVSPIYYFRIMYFSPFILLSIVIFFKYQISNFEKLLMLYNFFLFFFTFSISFFNSTVADRLNYFLFGLTFYTMYVMIRENISNPHNIFWKNIFLFYNNIIFTIWLFFSTSASLSWFPYQNILINYIIK